MVVVTGLRSSSIFTAADGVLGDLLAVGGDRQDLVAVVQQRPAHVLEHVDGAHARAWPWPPSTSSDLMVAAPQGECSILPHNIPLGCWS